MKRTVLVLAALAASVSLAGCGGSDTEAGAPDPAPSATSAPTTTAPIEDPTTSEAVSDEARYETTYNDVISLMAVLGGQSDVNPTSTEEANAAAGLDETTPLVFVDYTVLPDDDTTGSFCLVSNTSNTYVAITYSGAEGEIDLGDGECSYDTETAAVVGDVATNEWSLGGELMGDLLPQSAFGG